MRINAWWKDAVRVAVAVALSTTAGSCRREPADEARPAAPGDAHPALVAQGGEFERKVYRVTDGVYQAVGFGLANSILVEGDDCCFVVDVMGSVEAAAAVKAAFAEVTSKPIGALVYTHNHPDHVFGGKGFVPDGAIDVYAHETTGPTIDQLVSVVRPIIGVRSARMFGDILPHGGPDGLINDGIGPFLEIGPGKGTIGLIRPNRTFATELETEICGVKTRMEHAPGETDDQIFVWLPERGVLMPGDNVYKAFPNLYTIRGTTHRDVLAWAHSIDRMRDLEPAYLAPSHTRPISGAEQVAEVLTAYRDAIQFVHDQTVRSMNRGLTPDELVEVVRLPPHLRDHPYLQEVYGTVAWSVRSVFAGYLGWFDGDAATLSPEPPEVRANAYVELAGGEQPMLAAIGRALAEERFAWAAELADHLRRARPGLAAARATEAQALRALGRRSVSPNGRNYYLTQARELEGAAEISFEPTLDQGVREFLAELPVGSFMAAMPVHLDPDRAADVDMAVGFRFPDVGEDYSLHVRRGVAEFRSRLPARPDVVVTADSRVWKEVVLGIRNPAVTLLSGQVQVEGGTLDLVGFLRMFR